MALRKHEVMVLLIPLREEAAGEMYERSFLKFTASPIPSQLQWCRLLLFGSQPPGSEMQISLRPKHTHLVSRKHTMP